MNRLLRSSLSSTFVSRVNALSSRCFLNGNSPILMLDLNCIFLQQNAGFATKKRNKKQCPFKTLGLSSDCNEYADVKTAFLQIAMRHHPDMQDKTATEEEQLKARNLFIEARHAFEMIEETPTGGVVLQSEAHEMDGFDAWFRNETGHDTPFQFMDRQTMKEVSEMEETIGHGLDRDGGMWTLAAMVSKAHKDGGDATSMLKLEAGEVKNRDHIDGVLRRKRRPRR